MKHHVADGRAHGRSTQRPFFAHPFGILAVPIVLFWIGDAVLVNGSPSNSSRR